MTSRSSSIDIANGYLKRGWLPIPIPKGEKACKIKAWNSLTLTAHSLSRYFSQDSNIGIRLGKPSGWLVDLDLDHLFAVALAPSFMPRTLVFGRSGNPRSHLLYVSPGIKTSQPKGPGGKGFAELRSTGAVTVFPSSIHPSGDLIDFVDDSIQPKRVEPHELMRCFWMLQCATLIAVYYPPKGTRQNCAMALAGVLCKSGLPQSEAELLIDEAAIVVGDEESDKRMEAVTATYGKHRNNEQITGLAMLQEIIGEAVCNKLYEWLRKADYTSMKKASSAINRKFYSLTELGNADRFVAKHASDVKYVPGWGHLIWDGRRWRQDTESLLTFEYAKQIVRSIRSEARQEPSDEKRKALDNHVKASEKSWAVKALLELAKPELSAHAEQFDTDQMLFNCASGTLDLRTGNLRPHDPNDLITKISSVTFNAEATCERWLGFLDQIFDGNSELLNFMQKAVGYSLTGAIEEQTIFMCVGLGANGKSVMGETIRRLLGEYATTTDFSTFLAVPRSGGSPRNDLADLCGARFVWAAEPDPGARYSESTIKWITGGEQIRARHLYRDFFSYKPCFKIWLAANTRPEVRGVDDGIWRRIRVIPFNVTIPEHDRDTRLAAKLANELPGILNWALAGCQAWLQAGQLSAPKTVRAATSAYRDEQDILYQFLVDKCEIGSTFKVGATSLYQSYQWWSRENDTQELTQREFGRLLTERGFGRERGTNGRGVRTGLRLVKPVTQVIEMTANRKSVP